MKISRMLLSSAVLIFTLALTGTVLVALAQTPAGQPVDQTNDTVRDITVGSSTGQPVDRSMAVPESMYSAMNGANETLEETAIVLDDFSRDDGPIGGRWTVHDGSCNVFNNYVVCDGEARATYNYPPGDGNFAEADVFVNGTVFQYAGLLLNYGDGVENLFLKVQQQDGFGQFDHAACYIGNNGPAFGLGYFPLSSRFSSAHMSALRVGSTVTLKFTNVDSGTQPDQVYICEDAPYPEGTGIGILGGGGVTRLDNFGVGVPNIAIDLVSLYTSVHAGEKDTVLISVCNTGEMPLNWIVYEIPEIIGMEAGLDDATYTGPSPEVEITLEDVQSSSLPSQFELPLGQTIPVSPTDEVELIWKTDGSSEATITEPVVPEGVTALLLDDGSMDELWYFYFPGSLIWMNRFTPDPSDFPLQLNEIRIFNDGNSPGEDFNLVIYENTTSGPDPALGSHLVYTSTVTAQELDAWNIYPLDPPLTFNGPGDVMVGVLPHRGVDGYFFWSVPLDSSISQHRSWWGWYDGSLPNDPPQLPPADWQLTGDIVTAGNWMFRAYGEPIGENIPWLTEHPYHGPTVAGVCTKISITFDATSLAPGEYSGNIRFNNNDEDTPTITVPVSLTVTEPVIELSPLSLESTQLPDVISDQPLTLCNNGGYTITWTLAEFPRTQTMYSINQAGIGEWLYRDETGIMQPGNIAGETLLHPSAYRWTPAAPSALSILVYEDDAFHYPDSFIVQALQHLGLSYMVFYYDFPGFIDSLIFSGPWDLVVVGQNMLNDATWMEVVNNYIQLGGKAIVHSWIVSVNPGSPLWETMGVSSSVDDVSPSDPVYWWEPAHAFFNRPMSVPEFTDLIDLWSIVGQHITPLPGFEALAGYTISGPAEGEAALILGNDNRTLFKGFLDGHNEADLDSDGILDSVELWINLIHGMLFGISNDVPWLSEDPIRGTLAAGTCTDPTSTISIDSTGLAAGDYFADLQFNSNYSYVPTMTLPVSLTVFIPDIHLTPTSLELTLQPNQSDTLAFTISNLGSGNLVWSLTDDAAWLSLNPTSGNISSGSSKQVTVTFDASGLAPQEYHANISITSNDPDESSISLPVTLTVKRYQVYLPAISQP